MKMIVYRSTGRVLRAVELVRISLLLVRGDIGKRCRIGEYYIIKPSD
jgi:hypothetical protein